MGDEGGILGAEAAESSNGRSSNGSSESIGGLLGRVAKPMLNAVTSRLNADLDDRDPDYIREKLPQFWLLSSLWFRGEVRHMENIPDDRPVLLVGNHSGGNLTPDSGVFTLAFSSYFGVERPFYQLAHNLVLASPYGRLLRKFGTVSASHEHAAQALESGGVLLVYPGGDWEVHRPIWESGKVDFNGRKGFIKLALTQNVPIVPVVSIGGQETSLFLSRGDRLAKAMRLDKLFRLKVLPVSLAAPWGLNIGDFFGHIPLPAKITIDVLPPIDLHERFGPHPDLDEVYDYVTGQMQAKLDELAAERRLPIVG